MKLIKKLEEGVTLDQAAKDMDAEITVSSQGTDNQISRALDVALKKARGMVGASGDFPNILLVGDAGFGKTDIVKQWARANNINLVYKDAKTMNATDLGGMIARDPDNPRKTTRLGSNEFARSLSKPNSVLFLDEYNRAKKEIRGSLLTLIQNHDVWDPDAENETYHIDNFLFTIAAINPANAAYPGARVMDPAERSRFRRIPVKPNRLEHLKYLESYYTDAINNATDPQDKLENERRLNLARTLLTSKDFYYDTEAEIEDGVDDQAYIPLNYRSLKLALDTSDGTKDDFLDVWSDFCNYKKKPLIQDILKNYVEIEDKATDAISDESESDVFKKVDSIRSRLKKNNPNLKI